MLEVASLAGAGCPACDNKSAVWERGSQAGFLVTCAACGLEKADSKKVDQKREAPQFQAVDEGRYRLDVLTAGVTLELDYLRREGHQLKGELLVRCELPGALTFDGVLSASDINLSSTRARQMQAKYLAERSQAKELDWVGWLEELAQRVIAAERRGQPAVLLGDLPRPGPIETLEVDGLPLLARHPVILFGDGGTMKSYLALYIAGQLAKRGLRTGIFDWELCGEDHRDRLERLLGEEMPPIHYVRCTRPLVFEVERLRRIVRDEALDYVIFDSMAFACDGPPEAAEVAGRYFQALRRLGSPGSLHIAHVSKSFEGADQKPFGSVFWHNGARATWNVKLQETLPGETSTAIALHNRKANLSGKRPSVGFEFKFDRDRTHIRRVDLADVPDLAVTLPVRQRMALTLRHGALSPKALAEEIDADLETVKRTARRYQTQFKLLAGGGLALMEGRT